jgi:hypothetical protein
MASLRICGLACACAKLAAPAAQIAKAAAKILADEAAVGRDMLVSCD